MTIIVLKIGIGTEQDPIRPDTTANSWVKIGETDTTMTIEILE